MSNRFLGSRLKIERAKKHISNLESLLQAFVDSDFYDLSVQNNTEGGDSFLLFVLKTTLPADDYALIIGDALHNLRSALDLAYYQTVLLCDGTPSKWTRFPVRDTWEELVSRLDAALKEKQISSSIRSLMLNVIKPYKTGNEAIWLLDDLNIIDKHELLVPVLKLVIVTQVSFEDEYQRPLPHLPSQFFFGDDYGMAMLKGTKGMKVAIKNKGHAAPDILLARDILRKIQAVVPTLRGITEEVFNAIEAFDTLFDGLALMSE
jgi:hypothetical protein